MKSIGIDIGTTSVSAVVLDCDTGAQVTARTVPNDTFIEGRSWEHIQNVNRIYAKVEDLIKEFCDSWEDLGVIGLTGQMHGMVYMDENGEAVSNLATWEDERGNQQYKNRQTYAEYLRTQTGYQVSTGFGLTTLFYDTVNGRIPEGAVKIATIMDYVAMKLCGLKTPVTHSSDAASFGLFDLETGRFDVEQIKKAGMESSFLPEVIGEEKVIGKYNGWLPVMVPIGDNQAGVYALLEDDHDILVNVGTSSQISAVCPNSHVAEGLECRPYVSGKYVSLYAGLCGGVSFALLNDFFCQVCREFSTEVSKSELFDKMMEAARREYDQEEKLKVKTLFRGTRMEPSLRGSISNIGMHNFNPGSLTLGFYRGVCEELLDAYKKMKGNSESGKIILGGNAFRNNELLRKIASDVFEQEVICVDQREEAAVGAARLAASVVKSGR